MATLDEYVEANGLESRSAAVQRAVDLLRRPRLEQDHAQAWDEWVAPGDQETWDAVTADGLADSRAGSGRAAR